ncbi:hypothetical protein RHMOL_Rhmol03G0029900 [Rhododendron molle]|uniref:Uncharacterized protein n=1 Tax=Rhododendron molle TaxID=49168 RepID=A0ACC0PB32_RHOML|nr:hypothetical protein RHMOL_Rhmol03G0029900 [Rhododendron molle]
MSSAARGYPPQVVQPFAALVPSVFQPGTDPSIVSSQMADQDGSGLIDDKELQRRCRGGNQSFGLRTVHLLIGLNGKQIAGIAKEGEKLYASASKKINKGKVRYSIQPEVMGKNGETSQAHLILT